MPPLFLVLAKKAERLRVRVLSGVEITMSRAATAAFLTAVTAALVGQAFGPTPARETALGSQKAEPGAPTVREVDLTSIYSTSGQRKLVDVYNTLDERAPEWNEPSNIGEALRRAKSQPMLAVVRGETIKEAVHATARHVRLKKPPEQPVGPDDKSASKKYWLFVYLGSGHSGPLMWRVYPPTVYGAKVQFSYASFTGWFLSDPDETSEATADDHAYEYWVPLGTFEDPSQLKAELVELTKRVKAAYPAAKSKK